MSTQYLYRVNILSKKNSHPLDAIATYCGEDQFDFYTNQTYKSPNSEKVVWNNIITPTKEEDSYFHLPEFLKIKSKKSELISNARNILWRQVDCREIRPDSQFARVFELSIPFFLNQEESINLVHTFSKILVSEGMICDSSLHSHTKKPMALNLFDKLRLINQSSTEMNTESVELHQDYTAFIMCTLRSYENGIFENKNRLWNTKEKMKEWRYIWTESLLNAINLASEATTEQKEIWLKRLTIYPEYYEIINKKNNFKP
jgi:hypothetical protein